MGTKEAQLVVLAPENYEILMPIDVSIRGMTCGGCVASLQKVLQRDGLDRVTVELGVVHVPDDDDVARVEKAIEKAGFEVVRSER